MSRFRFWKTVCVVSMLCAAAVTISPAQTLNILHQFNGRDGAHPDSSLTQDTSGNLYGTTMWGGANTGCGARANPTLYKCGTVFELSLSKGVWSETVLHSFNGADGSNPTGALALVTDSQGNLYLYGTTGTGGTGYGTIFELNGTLSTLYNFSGTDGGGPWAGLVLGEDRNLYGTTYLFGAANVGANNGGTVFKITPSGTLTELFNFCAQAQLTPACASDPADGSNPTGALVEDSNGNFYGTTSAKGKNNAGTVFELSLSNGTATLTTLYSFCAQSGCADGSNPTGALALVTDSQGNLYLYGTTWSGGAQGHGTVFNITPNGTNSTLTTLYSFCQSSSCTDGAGPYAGLLQGTDGNFYGTTVGGGQNNAGTIFELSLSDGKWSETVLHSFNGTDGAAPYAGLIEDSKGNFYGTTDRGGTFDMGTVFQFCPGCSPGGRGTAPQARIGDNPPVPIATITIDPTQTAQAVSKNFMSIAQDITETYYVVGITDSGSVTMNPIYEQLIENLGIYQNQGPMLIRLLGDAGKSHYDKDHLTPLVQLHNDLLKFKTPVNVQFFAGVDYIDNDTTIATTEAKNLANNLTGGILQGIELGNEPDLYKRGPSWDYSEYLNGDGGSYLPYATWATAIMKAAPGVLLAAPVWSSVESKYKKFMEYLVGTPQAPGFTQSEAGTLSMVIIHHYSGTPTELPTYLLSQAAVCGDSQLDSGPGGPGSTLCPNWSDGVQYGVLNYVGTAHGHHLPFRIGELNSINERGQEAVSNSFSSALWGMDISFAYALTGVDGVNFFTPNSEGSAHYYSPFDFTYTNTNEYSVNHINPLYYGMRMFAQAAQNGASLLSITLTEPTATGANISAWATIDTNNDNTIRVLLLNKDVTASGDVTVTLTNPAGYGAATITRLTAPFYYSITGLTLGGQTFDGSGDGELLGTLLSESVPTENGTYTVSLPEVSAALVTIPRTGKCP
jgi:uncharacterized repeat protein (TIGR03803 family)